MKSKTMIPALFVIAAIYDGVLGLAFLFAPVAIFNRFDVEVPNHWAYVHFPAALLLVFTLMFLEIARRPSENRNLIPFGCLLKVSYCGVALSHWFTGGIPNMWKPFVVFDLFFLVLFLAAFQALGKKKQSEALTDADA